MIRKRVFFIRIALGLLFAFFLLRFFYPASGFGVYIFTALLLVFFAYMFEYIRKGNDGSH